MEQQTAVTWVKVYSVLGWIGAVLCLIGGLAMIFGGAFFGSMLASASIDAGAGSGIAGGVLGAFAIIMGVIMIVFGILYIFIAIGLWRYRNWARILMIIFSALGILSIFNFPMGIISAAISAWGLYLFAFCDPVKTLFTGAPTAVPAKKPEPQSAAEPIVAPVAKSAPKAKPAKKPAKKK